MRLVIAPEESTRAGTSSPGFSADWVPSLFEHTVLRDPGLNVAYWNIPERNIRRDRTGQVFAGTAPLKFFHFSGYDPHTPWLLSKHAGPKPRVRLADHPVIEDLCAQYAAELDRAGHADHLHRPYGLDVLPNGFRMTRRVRRLVRAAYLSKPADSWRPKPYSDPDGFVAWLTEPVHGTVGAPVNRWERSKWAERIDLQITFPDLSASSAAPFRSWLDQRSDRTGRARGGLPRLAADAAAGATPAVEAGVECACLRLRLRRAGRG